jgi:hypothetical protein
MNVLFSLTTEPFSPVNFFIIVATHAHRCVDSAPTVTRFPVAKEAKMSSGTCAQNYHAAYVVIAFAIHPPGNQCSHRAPIHF